MAAPMIAALGGTALGSLGAGALGAATKKPGAEGNNLGQNIGNFGLSLLAQSPFTAGGMQAANVANAMNPGRKNPVLAFGNVPNAPGTRPEGDRLPTAVPEKRDITEILKDMRAKAGAKKPGQNPYINYDVAMARGHGYKGF